MPPPLLPPLVAPTGPGVVDGTAGADLINADYVDADGDIMDTTGVVVDALDGDDEVYGSLGNDQIWGGDGDDDLISGPEWRSDPSGNDTLIGGAGDDNLVGSGADLLIGDNPSDTGGQGGDDWFRLLNGDITAYGGGGRDSFFIDHVFGGPGGRPLSNSGNQIIVAGEDSGPDPDLSNDRIIIATDPSDGPRINAEVIITGHEDGVLNYNGRSVEFHEIELIELDNGDDRVVVMSSTNMAIRGGAGHDTLVLPEPAEGEAPPIIEQYGSPGYGGGTATFADGSILRFYQFEEVVVESVICFAAGTLIDTDQGPKPVETLRLGDRVLTRDAGFQPLVWTGSHDLSASDLAHCPAVAPVRICAGSLGPDMPAQDLLVSPRHRMLIAGVSADLLFGTREVLVTAADLLGLPGVSRITGHAVTYVHVMCAEHQILRAHGAWSESFQPSSAVLEAMDAPTRAELLALFPDLTQPAARPVLSGAEAQELLDLVGAVAGGAVERM